MFGYVSHHEVTLPVGITTIHGKSRFRSLARLSDMRLRLTERMVRVTAEVPSAAEVGPRSPSPLLWLRPSVSTTDRTASSHLTEPALRLCPGAAGASSGECSSCFYDWHNVRGRLGRRVVMDIEQQVMEWRRTETRGDGDRKTESAFGRNFESNLHLPSFMLYFAIRVPLATTTVTNLNYYGNRLIQTE